ncbi:MAG TPA: hypothetical protein VLG25_01595 [Patescibacteria group bacterium]|nr:hypothetical protein [Patescibacteria group bacterium]
MLTFLVGIAIGNMGGGTGGAFLSLLLVSDLAKTLPTEAAISEELFFFAEFRDFFAIKTIAINYT